MSRGVLHAAVGAALALAVGCTEATTELLPGSAARGRDAAAGPDMAAADAALGDAALSDASSPNAARCGRHACACDDGLDQDGDMLVDGLDPECTGPYDDDEASFATGPDGVELPACQGCFWHGGMSSSASAGACSRPLDCAFGAEPPGALATSCGGCAVDQSCGQTCLPSTPNGCDCFGCCDATTPEGTVHVLLAGTCSLRDVKDEKKCPRCTPSPDCLNPCGTCELCGSKKRRDLARECRGMPTDEPLNTCDEGEAVCDETTPCPEPYYCQLGCCRIVVL